jgi:dephospho-CoA kinase
MSLFLIAGNAGSGKSTVCRALRMRGYEAYDTDDDGYAKWQHNETGYVHPKSSIKEEDRTPEFIKNHSWNVARTDVEDLAERAKDKSIFLCGAMGNEDELRGMFRKVFALYVDDATLQQRLAARQGNHWGKQPHEMQQTLEWQQYVYDKHRRLGSVLIDASQPVDTIVDAIISSADCLDT